MLWNPERDLLFKLQDLQSDKKSAQLDLKKELKESNKHRIQ